jgi:hypothetical protein
MTHVVYALALVGLGTLTMLGGRAAAARAERREQRHLIAEEWARRAELDRRHAGGRPRLTRRA